LEWGGGEMTTRRSSTQCDINGGLKVHFARSGRKKMACSARAGAGDKR
jgi:hypothetical protein